jgi:hypothetical protein
MRGESYGFENICRFRSKTFKRIDAKALRQRAKPGINGYAEFLLAG